MSGLELDLMNKAHGFQVRGGVSENGDEIWSVFDFVNLVCGKAKEDSYGRVTYYRVVKLYANALHGFCKTLQLSGSGRQQTPAMDLNGLLHLLNFLDGKVADQYRDMARKTLVRVLAGDRSLIKVIEANALSTAPLQQAFRSAVLRADDQWAGLGKRKALESGLEMDYVKEKLDFLIKEQRAGAIGMMEYLRLKREAIASLEHEPAGSITQTERVPLQNPFLIFFSALLNFLEKDIAANRLDVGATAPIKVKVCMDDVQQAYEAFYQPFLKNKFPAVAETVPINEQALIPSARDPPHTARLKELLLAQKNPLEMRIVGDPYFTKTVRELFPARVLDVSQGKMRRYRSTLRVYTFTLLDLKNFLQGESNYHDNYDEHVLLDSSVDYEIVPVSSVCYW